MKNGTTLSKQKSLIIILACLAALIAAACIVFPLIFKQQLNTVYAHTEYGDNAEVMIYDKSEGRSIKGDIEAIRKGGAKNTLSLKEGGGEDVLYTFRKNNVEITYRPYIYPELQLSEMARLTVTNSYGTYSIYNDGKDNFFIEGAEENLYNVQLMSELLLQARYMLADRYVENPSSPSDYGLTEETFSAKLEILSKSGEKNVVYVGKNEIGGSRYYMKHADKDMIYIMDSGAETFLNDVRFYLSADVLRSIEEQQRNYLSEFSIQKNGTPFFACEIIPEEERVGVLGNQLHRMTYPAQAYVLNIETLYDMFSKVGGLSGAGVMEYGVSKKENAEEILSHYGLNSPSYTVSFSYGDSAYTINVGNTEDIGGVTYYYVYSEYQDTVVPVEAASLDFLSYDIVDLFQENVFQYNITEVSSIELKYGAKTVNFVLSGEGDGLTVSETTLSKAIDTPSFRQFYISLLNVTIGGYSSVEGTAADTRKHELTFTVTLKSGEKMVFDFYGESTMSCHMIVDGKSGFKTDRKWIDKIVENSEKLLSGIPIGSAF